jgi:hypothetical protein
MDDIIMQIRALTSGTDASSKAKIQNALREVLSELESPRDFLVQLFNAVSHEPASECVQAAFPYEHTLTKCSST